MKQCVYSVMKPPKVYIVVYNDTATDQVLQPSSAGTESPTTSCCSPYSHTTAVWGGN